MIKFANSEFILAIKGSTFIPRGGEDELTKHTIGDLLLYGPLE